MTIKNPLLNGCFFLKNNSEIFFTPIDYRRPHNVFLLSEILIYDGTLEVIKDMRDDFKSKLNFNCYLENTRDENSSSKMQDYITKLRKWEINLEKRANQTAISEFENFKKQKNELFGDSITILEEKIREKVGKHFSFDPFLFGDIKKKNKIIRSILDLYNFILNANIFSPDMLFKCLFILIENIELKEEDTYAQTLIAIKRQKVLLLLEIQDEVFDDDLIDDDYRSGFIAANDFFYNFVHEFGHIIHHVYALSEKKLKNLNKNFKITNEKTSEEILKKNLKTRFWQKDKFKYPTVGLVINEAIDVIYKKFNVLEEREKAILWLAKWTAVPSFYGRGSSSTENDYTEIERDDREWFAEAFAYYYSTPNEQRTRIWEWWHEIFTKVLPAKFNPRY